MIARVAVALLLLATPAAHAQPAPPPHELAAGADWKPIAAAPQSAPGSTVLARLRRDPPGQVLVVTLLGHPNADRKLKSYRDQVVAGLAAATPGYRLLERRDGEPSSSWTIDLAFARTVDSATEVVAMRLYLVHDRTLTLAISTPAAAWPAARAATMKLLRSFRPRRQE